MALTRLADNTADTTNIASYSITSGIDSTYKVYIFKFYNINPVTDDVNFTFQVNESGETGYNETLTSNWFQAQHNEGDSDAQVIYLGTKDQAQDTGFQILASGVGNGADESVSGELYLFNPSDTTYVTNFFGKTNYYYNGDYSISGNVGGYFNLTEAIDEIQFKMSSGNFDGTIVMWGL